MSGPSSLKFQKIQDELASELHAIEERAHNVTLTAANNVLHSGPVRQDTEDHMEIAYELDNIHKFDRELHQTCGRLASMIDGMGPVIPKSRAHNVLSYLRKITEEIENMKLVNEKKLQQEDGYRRKAELIELQVNSLQRSLIGAQKKLADKEEERKSATALLEKVKEEFSHTRNDLHFVIGKLFPSDSEEMKSLLAALTEARNSSTEEDSWADISSCETAHVELLLRFCIIEVNPVDEKMARFTL